MSKSTPVVSHLLSMDERVGLRTVSASDNLVRRSVSSAIELAVTLPEALVGCDWV